MAKHPLTERQKEVLGLIQDHKTVPEIATALGIGEAGVYGHIRRMREGGHSIPDPAKANRNGDGPQTTEDPHEGSLPEDATDQFAALVAQTETARKAEAALIAHAERSITKHQEAIGSHENSIGALREEIAARKDRVTLLDEQAEQFGRMPQHVTAPF